MTGHTLPTSNFGQYDWALGQSYQANSLPTFTCQSCMAGSTRPSAGTTGRARISQSGSNGRLIRLQFECFQPQSMPSIPPT